MDKDEIKSKVRTQMAKGKNKRLKANRMALNMFSQELSDATGNGNIKIYYSTDKEGNVGAIKKKLTSRMNSINEEYMKGVKKGITFDGVKGGTVQLNTDVGRLKLTSSLKREPLKLVFNDGTDTTTTAIIGSSYSAGKTTIMMNGVLPLYYGRAKPNAKGIMRQKKVLSPASLLRGDRPTKKIQYINTLFALNTHIEHYKGYEDLIEVTGFESGQQQLIKDMHHINRDTNNKYRFALFIDDILNVKHSKMLENCFMTYRNAEISTCVCMQHLKFLSPAVRGNIQNIILCKLLSEETIQAVIDTYLASYFNKMGIPKAQHVQFYREATDKFNFIHLHQGTETIKFCSAIKIKG
jgi:hypothetical protein